MKRILPLLLLLSAAPAAWPQQVKVLQNVPSTYVYPVDGHIVFNIHRGTQSLLTMMLPGTKFSDPRGVACALLASDDDPKDPLDDVEITVIGVNSGAGELLYNASLKRIRKFGKRGSKAGEFLDPVGVALHRDGTVAVADQGNDRVALLHHDGNLLVWKDAVGRPGARLGEFSGPKGVAFDSRRNLYVADTGNNRIQVMSPDGRWTVFPASVPLEAPEALCVTDPKEAWTYFREGPMAARLAVIDRQGQRIQTFTLAGKFLNQADMASLPDGPGILSGCAFDYYGNVVATDIAKSCLRKFDKGLAYLCAFGSQGEGDRQFLRPRAIAVNKQLGQVIVAEETSAHYFWVGADALGLTATAEAEGWRVPFFLTERAILSAKVSKDGKPVTQLLQNAEWETGEREIAWTPDPSLPDGFYTLELDVMASYSSRERVMKRFTVMLKKPN